MSLLVLVTLLQLVMIPSACASTCADIHVGDFDVDCNVGLHTGAQVAIGVDAGACNVPPLFLFIMTLVLVMVLPVLTMELMVWW